MAKNTKIGALWLRKNDNVGQYLSGVLNDLKEDIDIVAFKNKNKGENGPDFLIYRSQKQEKQTASANDLVIEDENTRDGIEPSDEEINVDEIPFN